MRQYNAKASDAKAEGEHDEGPRWIPGILFRAWPHCRQRACGDKLSPMDSYIRWWEAEWFKEWERLALRRN